MKFDIHVYAPHTNIINHLFCLIRLVCEFEHNQSLSFSTLSINKNVCANKFYSCIIELLIHRVIIVFTNYRRIKFNLFHAIIHLIVIDFWYQITFGNTKDKRNNANNLGYFLCYITDNCNC